MGMKDALPYLGMVAVQFIQVGLIVAIKEATSSGMTKFTFVSCYNALSSLILLPTSFLIHRSTRPPITLSLLCKFFLLAVFGCIANVTGNAAIEITPASFTSAILNLVPGFTFILAVIFSFHYWEEWDTSYHPGYHLCGFSKHILAHDFLSSQIQKRELLHQSFRTSVGVYKIGAI